MDPYVGEIRIFSGNYAPVGWALCNGQLLTIQSNSALFSIIGFRYGGDNKSTFALPNLQAKAAVGQGAGQGLTPRVIASTGGSATATLLSTQMPSHTHMATSIPTVGGTVTPTNALWGTSSGLVPKPIYSKDNVIDTQMNPTALASTGGSQPHNNMQPYVSMSFIIALEGVYPPKS